MLHTAPMDRGEKQSGFTLIELMVALAIAMIVITLSTPLSNVYKQNRVSTQVHEFVSALNLARSEAITRGNTVSVCVSDGADPANCDNVADENKSWENGWLVFSDSDNNCTVSGDDVILHQHNQLNTGFSLRVDTHECIQYNANGITPNSSGVWTLCDPSKKDQFKRGVEISLSGRVKIHHDPASAVADGVNLAACPA